MPPAAVVLQLGCRGKQLRHLLQLHLSVLPARLRTLPPERDLVEPSNLIPYAEAQAERERASSTNTLEGTPRERRIIRGEFFPPQDWDYNESVLAPWIPKIEAVVANIAFDATALPVLSLEYQPRADGCFLQVTIDVLSTYDNKPLTVSRAAIVPWEFVTRNGAGYLVEWTRETIVGLFVHEIAERLSYRGTRAFDVHPYQRG